jgi:hypothetical protein
MKTLIYAAAAILASIASIPTSQAAGAPSDAKVSYIIYSTAYPKNARVQNATYHIGVEVAGYSLSQLSIEIPELVKTRRGIAITDQFGKEVDAIVSFKGRLATIAFAQPVSPGTTLELDMKGVNTLGTGRLGRTWLFPISSRYVGLNADIPLGTARIQSYK